MIPVEHLNSRTRKLLSLTDEQRICEMQRDNVWIDYPQSAKVFETIENFVNLPQRSQAPCLIVTGEGGSGKTSIINRLKYDSTLNGKLAFMAANVNPYNVKFADMLADALGVPAPSATQKSARRDIVPEELGRVMSLRKIKGVVIDELQDAMLVPRPEQQRTLSLMKGISNAPYGICLIGLGTVAARHALTADHQLSRRFHQINLQDWSETEDFRSFLAGIERSLPLKYPSNLDSEEIVGFLLSRTTGRMDDIVKLLRAAGCYSIVCGDDRITIKNLDRAHFDPWGY